MLNRHKAAIIVLLVLAWPAFGLAQPGPACVHSGIAAGQYPQLAILVDFFPPAAP
jgi:hypothetical protein